MQCNYAARPTKPWVEHVVNDDNPERALAQNFLLFHDLDDKVISKKGDERVYVSDALAVFKRFSPGDL